MKAVFVLRDYDNAEIGDMKNNIERLKRILCINSRRTGGSGLGKMPQGKNRFKSCK